MTRGVWGVGATDGRKASLELLQGVLRASGANEEEAASSCGVLAVGQALTCIISFASPGSRRTWEPVIGPLSLTRKWGPELRSSPQATPVTRRPPAPHDRAPSCTGRSQVNGEEALRGGVIADSRMTEFGVPGEWCKCKGRM